MTAEQERGESLFVGVNKPVDPNNLSELEKKHLPEIDAPGHVAIGECFTATVEVGKLLAHPNEHTHFIQFVELYADDTFLARVDLTSVKTCPKATLWVRLEGYASELRAYAHCNMHGTWVSRKPVQVT